MDPTKASYKRYWEPGFLQTMGLSMLAGTIAVSLTHPIEYIKTVIQYRSEGVGIRGYRSTHCLKQLITWVIILLKYGEICMAEGAELCSFMRASRPIWSVD